MSVKSFFRIVSGIATSPAAKVLVNTFAPGALGIFSAVVSGIGFAETTIQGDKQGSVKLPISKDQFYAEMATLNGFLAVKKKRMIFKDADLEKAISDQVTAMNSMQALMEGMDWEDVP